MPFDIHVLPLFLLTSLIALATPGPDVAFIVATGISQGRRAAAFGAVGIAVAILAHTFFATVGVATLVATSPLAFDLIRYGGALYLGYLAFKAFRAPAAAAACAQSAAASPLDCLRRGFLTNLLNPKAVLFMSVFLPQFAAASYGPIFMQMAGLGVVMALMALAFMLSLALATGSFGQWLISSPMRQRLLERATGTIFLGLAARLLVMGRAN